MNLPPDVQRVKKVLAQNPKNELHKIAKALISDDPDLVKMWKSISRAVKQRAEKSESTKYLETLGKDGWVLTFLGFCRDAKNPPPYFRMLEKDRRKLSSRIKIAAKQLNGALTANKLDAHVVRVDLGEIHRFELLEDCGFFLRASLDMRGIDRIAVSKIIERISDWATNEIANQPPRGKGGRGFQAVQFVREMAKKNKAEYGGPLLNVVSTACLVLCKTNYSKADISKLVSRQRLAI